MQIIIDLPDEGYQVTLTKIMLACPGCKITEIPKKQTDEGPRGKWRSLDDDTVICSECGQMYRGMILPDYCPRCHAKMTSELYEE